MTHQAVFAAIEQLEEKYISMRPAMPRLRPMTRWSIP